MTFPRLCYWNTWVGDSFHHQHGDCKEGGRRRTRAVAMCCGVTNHAVVVDAGKLVIIGSKEEAASSLSAEVLGKCGGPVADKLRVREVRRIEYFGSCK